MGLTRVVHVKTHLPDCVGNVWLGKGQALEDSTRLR
jgi:hypothetical protein